MEAVTRAPTGKVLADTVTNLIRLTQEGKIRWDRDPDAPILRRDLANEDVGVVLVGRYMGHTMYLYEMKQRAVNLKNEIMHWTDRLVLQIADESGAPLWTFPDTPALRDLLDAAGYQTADIDGFIRDVLQGPEG